MLLRLIVKGFKNLENVDIRFGPFTCIAGQNGAGKSNIFDAIQFLSDLASMPLNDAAQRVRNPHGRPVDIRDLFTKRADGKFQNMSFSVDIAVPHEVEDELGLRVMPAATFLNYTLIFSYVAPVGRSRSGLRLEYEHLQYIPSSTASKEILFANEKDRKSVV